MTHLDLTLRFADDTFVKWTFAVPAGKSPLAHRVVSALCDSPDVASVTVDYPAVLDVPSEVFTRERKPEDIP